MSSAIWSNLAITLEALSVLLLSDGAVVDRQAERRVCIFGRDLRRLLAKLGQTIERTSWSVDAKRQLALVCSPCRSEFAAKRRKGRIKSQSVPEVSESA